MSLMTSIKRTRAILPARKEHCQSNELCQDRVYKGVQILYYCGKFLGLCPFKLERNRLKKSRIGMIYNVILVTFYVSIFWKAMLIRSSEIFPRETGVAILADTGAIFLRSATVITIWLQSAFAQRKLATLVELFTRSDVTAEKWKIPNENAETIKSISTTIFGMNMVFLSFYVAEAFLQAALLEDDREVFLIFNFLDLVEHNMIAFFSGFLYFVERKYTILNRKIRAMGRSDASYRGSDG